MSGQFFRLEGPLCALERGSAFQTVVCERCERAFRKRIRAADVELVCKLRRVWRTDGGAILLGEDLARTLGQSVSGLVFAEATRAWRKGMRGARSLPPVLLQLGSEKSMRASPESVEHEDCECGAIRSIALEPLVVQRQELAPSDGVWYLVENPEILIFSAAVKEELLLLEPDLEFTDVYVEGTYERPSRAFEGDDWSNL